MSDCIKLSNKELNKKIIEEKHNPKKLKSKVIYNTMIDLEKYNYSKRKKISKSKSSSVIIKQRKNSEKKKHLFIPINLKGPTLKTNNTKKKIAYNKSTSDLFNEPYKSINNNKVYTNKNSQHNTINYIMNNFNLSSKKKDSLHHKKINQFKGISKSIISVNNNNNNNKINNNNTNSNNNKNNDCNSNSKYEELKKENEKLILLFNEKIKDNKKFKNKINYLENKNDQILKKINKIKKENEKYSKILEKVLKLLQILKSNGLDVEEILENLSITDDDDLENDSNSDDDISSIHSKKSSDNNSAINSEFSHFKSEGESIPNDDIQNHKIYNESKVILKDNSIPKLDMEKIYNNNKMQVQKFETNNTHKHKNYSHSVGK